MIMAAQPHLATVSGGVANFTADMALPLKECKVSFLPVQSGSGDPSPENVRPISGWDGCTVWRAGKNLFNGRLVNKNVNANGSENDATNRLSTLFEPIKAGTYTLSFDSNFVCALYVFSSDQVGSQIAEESNIYWNVSPLTFNITNGKYYRIKFKHNTDKSIAPSDLTDVQVEVGSTATPYEPYTATTYPVTWQSAGTVYGGYVDLVRGVLVAEWAVIDLGTKTYQKDSTLATVDRFNFELSDMVKPNNSIPFDAVCESYKSESIITANYNKSTGVVCGLQTNIPRVFFYTASGTYSTAADFKNSVSGVKLAYKLATPITYTLTPQQITTLIGTNNIWSDAGDVELTYWSNR